MRKGKKYNELVIDRIMGSCYNSPDTRNGDGGHGKISSTVTCRKGDWMMKKKNSAIGRDWEEVERDLFTSEEIAKSDLRVALMTEIIRARHEKGITQKQLEALSGVKQPVIARMEGGESDPRIETVMKVLAAIGMTLKVTPIQ